MESICLMDVVFLEILSTSRSFVRYYKTLKESAKHKQPKPDYLFTSQYPIHSARPFHRISFS